MITQFLKCKCIAILLAWISVASIPTMARADWSIVALGGSDGSYATDINDSGQVVGLSGNNHDWSHAFITGPNGVGMTDLGTLGGSSSRASAINDIGEVVGSSRPAGGAFGDDHAFLFSHGGMTDLSLLAPVVAAGWSDLVVTDINNHGQMVGHGINSTGENQAFLLSYTPDTVFDPQPIYIPPVPEPETYGMLLVGLGFLGFMTWRRKIAGV